MTTWTCPILLTASPLHVAPYRVLQRQRGRCMPPFHCHGKATGELSRLWLEGAAARSRAARLEHSRSSSYPPVSILTARLGSSSTRLAVTTTAITLRTASGATQRIYPRSLQ